MVKRILKRMTGSLSRDQGQRGSTAPLDDGDSDFALDGYRENRISTPFVESLSDDELVQLNRILRWHCFTADSRGRRFGRRSKAGKRDRPQIIPDPRIVRMDNRFELRGKAVLELGCFEGVHTVALAMHGARVTAVDSRVENVVKSIVRTALFRQHATIFKCDVEDQRDWRLLPKVDLLHHVGVLYHLRNPAEHLLLLGELVGQGLMLDTHCALAEQAVHSYEVRGRRIAYKRYGEGGRAEVFSGMYDHAKWLTLPTIRELLSDAGFPRVQIVEERAERNGPRVLLFASRS